MTDELIDAYGMKSHMKEFVLYLNSVMIYNYSLG